MGLGSRVKDHWSDKELGVMQDLTDGRTYWAGDRLDGSSDQQVVEYAVGSCPACCQSQLEWRLNRLPKGWLSDFWYFSRNYHPLLGIFLADDYFPLLRRD